MQGETQALAWVMPVAVQIALPLVLAVLGIVGGVMGGKIKAKNERIKIEQDHALALAAHQSDLAAQQADFDGKKKEAAMARDKQLYDIQQQIIDQMQESQRDSAHREARMDEKFNELYSSLGYERSHSLEWEEWYRKGMPDPPGKPMRRNLTQPQPATPPGGSLL